MKDRKKTKKIAAGAVLSALGVVILLFGNIIPVLDLTMVVIASFAVVFAVIEMGNPYPYLIYSVTGILALILLPEKIIALEYLLFGGIYPILKAVFERYHYIISWILKFSLFNTGLLLMILLSNYVMNIPDNIYILSIPIFLAANIFFAVYDIAMTKIITMYLVVIRKKLKLKDIF